MARETQSSPASERKLEQYGVWVKVKPRELTDAPPLEESFELSDLESPKTGGKSLLAKAQESALTAEEETLLNELETELSPEGEAGENVLVPDEEPLLAESELPDLESEPGAGANEIALGQSSDEELPELEEEQEPRSPLSQAAEPSEVEVTLSEDIVEKDHFNDLEALETELASVTTRKREPSASSAEILSRIEEELRSIRTDLTQLRGELSGLRASAAEAPAAEEEVNQAAPGGFFDEDEDETIALTGDELDNILNTAEITEEPLESAPVETPTMELETEAAAPQEDILSYETPVLEEGPTPAAAPAEEEAEPVDLAEETLVLADDELPAMEEALEEPLLTEAEADELPAELVLEEEPAEALPAKAADELPSLDLEGLPEIEEELAPVEEAPARKTAADEESETIDLETLDLGEEPTVVNAVAEQVEDVEALGDLESIPELTEEATEEQGPTDADIEALADEVDLEALAAEAQELEDEVPAAPKVDDLELVELEAPAEPAAKPAEQAEEIEISFESDLDKDVESLEQLAEPESLETVEQVAEAEEAESAAKPAPAGGIPDNLKDEIRTVLKYMDHLLEALPDEKIQEFASSDYFVMYKKLFEDLGLGE
jgi:pilus assembly protein FimV